MKFLVLLAALLLHGVALAQSPQQAGSDISYDYLELRFVDVDTNGGDGLRFKGSYQFPSNWLIVGGITSLDFNRNVDGTIIEVGTGYVWDFKADFDLFATLQYVNVDFDTPGSNSDDDGVALSAGTRGLISPEFEVRGSVNHISLDDSDTYLELAGDYYFTQQFSAGLSVEFAGDNDVITIGARWFFR
jgi:hypothetical protein